MCQKKLQKRPFVFAENLACLLFVIQLLLFQFFNWMEGERVNVLLNTDFLLVILNICSQNQANVVFIAKFRSNSCLIRKPNNMGILL